MAFDGSGVFNRIHSWVQDLANGIAITASRMDDEMDGFATGLSNCITKDGQTTVTANIPFNGSQAKEVGDATALTDAANARQVQNQAFGYTASTTGSDTYAATLSPAPAAYAAGQEFTVLVTTANTGAATINFNTLGAKAIKRQSGADIATGDIQANSIIKLVYDGTNFQIVTQIGGTVGGGDLLAAQNLADLSSAATSRTNLGVEIGADVQGWDADLDAIAGVVHTANGILVSNGSTWAIQSGSGARSSLGLTIGTNVQAEDEGLSEIAALSSADGNFIVGSASGWGAESGATARTSLGLTIGTNVQAWDADLDAIADLAKTENNFVTADGAAWRVQTPAQIAAVLDGETFNFAGTQYINDTANSNMSLGLTINQGANDDEILAFKSSDVTHGVTDFAETDTYAHFLKQSAASGGLQIRGFTESILAFSVVAVGTTADTTDTSASTGAIELSSRKKSGTGLVSYGATENIWTVSNEFNTRVILKGNGDMHITNTTLVALDGYDDVALVRTFERETREQGIVDHPLDNQIVYSRKHLEEAGVLRGDFLNVQSWMAMSGGAIWQLATGLDDVNRRLSRLEA